MKKKKIKKNTDGEKDRSKIGDGEVILQKSQSSVSIKKDAKGNTSFELKVYADEIEDARILALANFEELAGELGLAEE